MEGTACQVAGISGALCQSRFEYGGNRMPGGRHQRGTLPKQMEEEKMQDIITLDYGSGGKKTAQLIEEMLVPAFRCDELEALGDGAVLNGFDKLVFSTDSFVVNPVFFPGGDIGKLSVCGTVNDISVSGGIPKYLSLGLIIEEGFLTKDLEKIIASIKKTAKSCGVKIVTGDTKVVEKGKADGIYINTAGIGSLLLPGLSPANMEEGDAVIISGTAGDHGISVMLARNSLIAGEVASDCAPVNELAQGLMGLGRNLKVMRDPTRGGVATTLCEFLESSAYSIELSEKDIPVKSEVQAACDILGLDPLYCACEGRLLAVVKKEAVGKAVEILRNIPGGGSAAIIGEVTLKAPGKLLARTEIGGFRVLSKLAGSELPRIC